MDAKLIYCILNTALLDLFGYLGSSKISFSIVAHKRRIAVVRLSEETSTKFLSALIFYTQHGKSNCRISCRGSYPSLLSASRKVEIIVNNANYAILEKATIF